MTERFKLPEHFEIDPEIREQMSDRPGHQRCLEGAGELFLVLHEVPEGGRMERDSLFFWKRRDGLWVQQSGAGIGGLGRLLDRYEQAVEDLEGEIDRGARAEVFYRVLRRSSPMVRSSGNLVAAIAQAQAMEPDDDALQAYLDRAREVERQCELLHGDARAALAYWHTRLTEDQAEAGTRLNRIALRINLALWILLPMVALAALPGMGAALVGALKTALWVILVVGGVGGLVMFGAAYWRKRGGRLPTRWRGL
ncbi:MAG: hypothetical protein ACQCXQ_15960 [Verrucomicrobiales bacterium]